MVLSASGCDRLRMPLPPRAGLEFNDPLPTVETESTLEVATRMSLCDLTICEGVEPKKLDSFEMERSCKWAALCRRDVGKLDASSLSGSSSASLLSLSESESSKNAADGRGGRSSDS
jgi:hypothetical protein